MPHVREDVTQSSTLRPSRQSKVSNCSWTPSAEYQRLLVVATALDPWVQLCAPASLSTAGMNMECSPSDGMRANDGSKAPERPSGERIGGWIRLKREQVEGTLEVGRFFRLGVGSP